MTGAAPDPAIVLLECGCFFRGRKFITDPECEEHAEDDESYNSMRAIKARHQATYGHLTAEEIAAKTQEGLARIKADGIVPSMTAEELMKLTRGDD